MEANDIVTFLDTTGRIIYGKFAGEDETYLKVADPAQIYVQPTQNGQLNVQSIPLFFKEFVKNAEPTIWKFNKSSITTNENLQLDERLITQYNNILAPRPAAPQPGVVQSQAPATEAKVVKLFDE